ncbi:SGNH/GDSL hydrolase family protein [Bdellovibrio sp. HCB209]|uniref:SGNH/GDSL hydrolase family protein n=1 Tax=Bdellovibrio sp. HCB209 TaxID=3394354 RepID=UPI0039B55462
MKNVIALLILISGSTSLAFNTVFVGDSHSYGKFGEEVDKYLRSVSTNVTSVASCGSSPSTWMAEGGKYKTTNCGYWRKDIKGQEKRVKSQAIDSFPNDVKLLHPDLTVIALGTNILASPTNIKSELKSIQAMVDTVKKSNSECIWIGPPSLGKDPFKKNLSQGIAEIKSVVEKGGCAYVDSAKLTQYPSGNADGIHYGPKDSSAWGQSVVKEIKELPQVARARTKDEAPMTEKMNKGASASDSSGAR